jgi:hypothetical protein
MMIRPSVYMQILLTAWVVVAAAPAETPDPSSRRTPLAISEIMYHPAERTDGLEGEFVEIYNSQPWVEDISGFRLEGAITFEFPASTTIGANGFVVVAKAPADLKDFSGFDAGFGPWEGRLANDNETVRLLNSSGAVLLEVPYKDSAPWPVEADGLGHSIVLGRASFGEGDPRAWRASDRSGGSPGKLDEVTASPLEEAVLNEVYGHPTEPELGFVEIMNKGPEPVDLSGAELEPRRPFDFRTKR